MKNIVIEPSLDWKRQSYGETKIMYVGNNVFFVKMNNNQYFTYGIDFTVKLVEEHVYYPAIVGNKEFLDRDILSPYLKHIVKRSMMTGKLNNLKPWKKVHLESKEIISKANRHKDMYQERNIFYTY